MRISVRSPVAIAVLATACGARSTLPTPEPMTTRPAACGNGIVEHGEECDDGNTSNADACTNECRFARCGDGIVEIGIEACDDGNQIDNDACRNNCALPSCGDGVVQAGEECDDGNKNDTDACTNRCLFARCGDGVVEAGAEECDLGPMNGDFPAILLTQGNLSRAVRPIDRATTVTGFYDYHSASAHTGFEAVSRSELYLFRDTTTGILTIVTEHGIDIDATGIVQPESDVVQSFTFLPATMSVAITDDKPSEFFLDSPTSARGEWHFNQNTDGGALSGLPLPGNWSIDIDSDFQKGVTAWVYVDGDATPIDLTLTTTARLTAYDHGPACRLNCTIPRCGDGIVDAGEVCDDGNTISGDGCAADCKSLK